MQKHLQMPYGLDPSFLKPITNIPKLPNKKPIYSTSTSALQQPPTSTPSSNTPLSPRSPTPTDRLAVQVKRARLVLHSYAASAEESLNNGLTYLLRKETSLANTIASLAPAPETGEQLLPGAIYVLVATMAGSIISRNRGLFLRAATPLAVGITAGWMLIPATMRNIADLGWEYEKKVPAISETHESIGRFTRETWRQAKIHARAMTKWADQTAESGREKVEGWVKRG